MNDEPSRGGARPGAGRPRGSGRYGSGPTKVVRIPVDRLAQVERLLAQDCLSVGDASLGAIHRPAADPAPLERPLYVSRVAAGFPSPAEDYVEGTLDLNRHLIHHPAATFFVRVTGTSMLGAGIHPGDILIVDRALEAGHDKVVIAVLDGELTVKRLRIDGERVWLVAESEGFEPIRITEDVRFEIWGVVTHVIHSV